MRKVKSSVKVILDINGTRGFNEQPLWFIIVVTLSSLNLSLLTIDVIGYA